MGRRDCSATGTPGFPSLLLQDKVLLAPEKGADGLSPAAAAVEPGARAVLGAVHSACA